MPTVDGTKAPSTTNSTLAPAPCRMMGLVFVPSHQVVSVVMSPAATKVVALAPPARLAKHATARVEMIALFIFASSLSEIRYLGRPIASRHTARDRGAG